MMYGFAAVSSEPSPLPMMKIQMQKPANDLLMMAGIASSAPRPYRNRPQMKTARYPKCRRIHAACPREARGYALVNVSSYSMPPLGTGYIPKVCCLQPGGSGLVNVERLLEVLIEGIEQAVTEPPEEKEDGYQADGIYRLSQGQLRGLGPLVVGHPQRAPLPKSF